MNRQKKMIYAIIALLITSSILYASLTAVNIYLHVNKSSPNVNITALPMNYTCLMDSNKFLLGQHLYVHTCYNIWLDQTIVDLRYLEDGNISLNYLSNKWIKMKT